MRSKWSRCFRELEWRRERCWKGLSLEWCYFSTKWQKMLLFFVKATCHVRRCQWNHPSSLFFHWQREIHQTSRVNHGKLQVSLPLSLSSEFFLIFERHEMINHSTDGEKRESRTVCDCKLVLAKAHSLQADHVILGASQHSRDASQLRCKSNMYTCPWVPYSKSISLRSKPFAHSILFPCDLINFIIYLSTLRLLIQSLANYTAAPRNRLSRANTLFHSPSRNSCFCPATQSDK